MNSLQQNHQRGVTLVITFFVMVILLAIVMSISLILFNETRMMSNMGNSVAAFYAAETGSERTLYLDRKEIPPTAIRGFCNICNVCSLSGCTSCSLIPLDAPINAGCDIDTCSNCQVLYTAAFSDKEYSVDARLTPDPMTSGDFFFNIDVRGFYKDIVRALNLNLIENNN